MTENTGTIITASGRTLEEMKAGIRIRMRNMVNSALEIGFDLMEAKDACRHGEWMPFLKDIGLSASTAANYMRIAKEVSADSKMATLPYTKILALLAAPPEEREELAAAAEDMSAAEIRRLTEERNRAAEAANAETARANQAEADAKRFYDENAALRSQLNVMDQARKANLEHSNKMNAKNNMLLSEIDHLKEQLVVAENEKTVEYIEKVPEDYERIKAQLAAAERSAKELIDAAADAEERAAEAEAALEDLRNENAQSGVSEFEKMHFALRSFLMQCEHMALQPAGLYRDAEKALKDVGRLRLWCDTIEKALNVQNAEGAVL